MAFFQPFLIHRPALNRMVFYDLSCPRAELHSTLVVDLKADRNDHLETVMIHLAGNLTASLNLNCQVFLDSCFRKQFAIIVYALDMLGDGLF